MTPMIADKKLLPPAQTLKDRLLSSYLRLSAPSADKLSAP
jgi:hypothetical protein